MIQRSPRCFKPGELEAYAAETSDADAIFLEKLIDSETDPELKEAIEDLNDFLFNY